MVDPDELVQEYVYGGVPPLTVVVEIVPSVPAVVVALVTVAFVNVIGYSNVSKSSVLAVATHEFGSGTVYEDPLYKQLCVTRIESTHATS